MPPVPAPGPAGLTVVVTNRVPAGITGWVAGGSRVGVEAGVTSGNGPTPARAPGGLRTAVAHAPLTTPQSAAVTVPKSLHHEAPAQAPLPGLRGPSHPLRSVNPHVPCVPATATGRPRGFPEREPRAEAVVTAPARPGDRTARATHPSRLAGTRGRDCQPSTHSHRQRRQPRALRHAGPRLPPERPRSPPAPAVPGPPAWQAATATPPTGLEHITHASRPAHRPPTPRVHGRPPRRQSPAPAAAGRIAAPWGRVRAVTACRRPRMHKFKTAAAPARGSATNP
jgi:hypothetical protein